MWFMLLWMTMLAAMIHVVGVSAIWTNVNKAGRLCKRQSLMEILCDKELFVISTYFIYDILIHGAPNYGGGGHGRKTWKLLYHYMIYLPSPDLVLPHLLFYSSIVPPPHPETWVVYLSFFCHALCTTALTLVHAFTNLFSDILC